PRHRASRRSRRPHLGHPLRVEQATFYTLGRALHRAIGRGLENSSRNEAELEARAARGAVSSADRAAETLERFFGRRQPDPGAVRRLRREERFEDAVQMLAGDAGPLVFEGDADGAARDGPFDGDGAAV